jgi:type I restriction enzyme S subunit
VIVIEQESSAAIPWTTVPLSEAVDILDSKRVPVNRTERAKRPGNVPYYGATGQVDWIDDFLFDEELVLLGEDGAPFLEPQKPKAYRIVGKSWVNNHAHILRAKCGIDSKYLVYFLNTVDYRPFVSGTTRLKLTQAAMRQIPILLPSLDEQIQIVERIETQFARLDDAVSALERARTRLKRYRASVLKAACEGRLVPTEAELARKEGRSYEPASVLLERIRVEREAAPDKKRGKSKNSTPINATRLPELPDGWEWSRLGESILEGPTNGLYKPASEYGSGLPIIRIDDFQDFAIRPRSQLRQLHVSDDELAKYAVSPDDLIINRVNSAPQLGKSMIVPVELCPAVFESNMMGMKLSKLVQVKWVLFYLQSTDGRQRLTQNAKWAVNQASINQTDIRCTPVPLPPVDEQARIVEEVERRLSVIEQMEATVETNLKRSEALRQSILRLAFSGRLLRQEDGSTWS